MRSNTTHTPFCTGFTLIEILVALAMVIAIMGVLYGSYQAVTRSVGSVGFQARADRTIVFFLDRLERQLRCSVHSSQQGHGPATRAPVGAAPPPEEPNESMFLGAAAANKDGFLGFVTTWRTRRQVQPLGGFTEVRYRWDRAGRVVLVRYRPYVPQRSPTDHERHEDWHTVLSRVIGLSCEYYNGRDWQDDWRAKDQPMKVPVALRITVTTLDPQNEPRQQSLTIKTEAPETILEISPSERSRTVPSDPSRKGGNRI
ncbi:type II secretion system protein GspJ [Planctomycetota bacterium]